MSKTGGAFEDPAMGQPTTGGAVEDPLASSARSELLGTVAAIAKNTYAHRIEKHL
jgi:hypothetical protein